MTRADAARAFVAPNAAVAPRIGVQVALVQFLFALCWTVYAIYLPALAAQAGIARTAVPWLLMADQLVFAATDLALGVMADRVARALDRLGIAIALVTLLSGVALLLLPWVAPHLGAGAFLALTVLWVATASALRAPPLVLLGRHAARPALPWLAALTLLGLGVASAIAPYLALALRGVDPRAPFALASGAVVVATLALVRAARVRAVEDAGASIDKQAGVDARSADSHVSLDAGSATPVSSDASFAQPSSRAPTLIGFVCAVALFGFAAQVHQFVNSASLYLRHATPAELPHLAPVFWVGFSFALFPASLATRRAGALTVAGLGAAAAALAAGLAPRAPTLGALVALQGVAGAAWGAVLASALATALVVGRTGREGRATGALFSLLALAAAARIAIVASGRHQSLGDTLLALPALAWAAAGVLLLVLAWLQGRRTVAAVA